MRRIFPALLVLLAASPLMAASAVQLDGVIPLSGDVPAGPVAVSTTPVAEVRRVQATMGTVLEIRAWAPTEEAAMNAITRAFEEVARLERVFSLYNPDSDLSRFNASEPGTAVAVGPDILELVKRCRDYLRTTDGAFDATIDPLARFWREGGEWSAAEWSRRAKAVGFEGFEIDENRETVTRLRADAGLNFDGIAKGTALDAAAEMLLAEGAVAVRMNFGGEILAVGPQKAEEIQVADPATGVPLVAFPLDRGAVATSSQHERTTEAGGRSWGHIIDPRTRRVLEREGSVTVLAATAEEADALSTALLVLGPDDGGTVITSRFPRAAALFIEPISGGWRLTPTARFPSHALRILSDDVQIVLP